MAEGQNVAASQDAANVVNELDDGDKPLELLHSGRILTNVEKSVIARAFQNKDAHVMAMDQALADKDKQIAELQALLATQLGITTPPAAGLAPAARPPPLVLPHLNLPPPHIQAPAAPLPSDPTTNLLLAFQQMMQIQQGNYCLNVANQFEPLTGEESTSDIRSYLDRFTMATNGWTDESRVQILTAKFKNRAQRVYRSLTAYEKMNYAALITAFPKKLAEMTSTGIEAFNDWMLRQPRKPDESIDKYADDIEHSVRRAMPPDTPFHVIDQMCKMSFQANLDDELIVSTLLAQRNLSFYETVNLAVSIQQSRRIRRPAHPAGNKQSGTTSSQSKMCEYCSKPGHTIEICFKRLRDLSTQQNGNFSSRTPAPTDQSRNVSKFTPPKPQGFVRRSNVVEANVLEEDPVAEDITEVISYEVQPILEDKTASLQGAETADGWLLASGITCEVNNLKVTEPLAVIYDPKKIPTQILKDLPSCYQSPIRGSIPKVAQSSGKLPFINVIVLGQPVKALFDTGAQNSLVSSDF